MKPTFFADQELFRAWLEEHHATATELLVGYYKVGSGKPSMTWPESVDQALCFGWIDGIRRSLGEESYCIRFTPRKANSNWSAVNIRKVEELKAKGLMTAAGLAAYAKRTEGKSRVYGYEEKSQALSREMQAVFQKDPAAWAFFDSQAPYYKKKISHWIMSAKRQETRLRRLRKARDASAREERLM